MVGKWQAPNKDKKDILPYILLVHVLYPFKKEKLKKIKKTTVFV